MKKIFVRFASATLALTTTLSLTTGVLAASNTFTDVPENYWGYSYIERAAAEGYVNGIGDNKFAPEDSITSAEFTALLVRAFLNSSHESYNKYFHHDEWWRSYMEVAMEFDVLRNAKAIQTKSTQGRWDDTVNQPIDRYEMALYIYNLMAYTKPSMGTGKAVLTMPSASTIDAAKAEIADWSSIPENYREAVVTCYAAGILGGVDDNGTFDGTGVMNRAQSAAVLCRLMDMADGKLVVGEVEESDLEQTVSGEKDAMGYTTAASVNNVKDRNKSDAYPTKGHTDTVSVNGYHTGSQVDVGDAVLVYEFLDMVNEARRAEGLHELKWVESDAAEEYTLVRANDLTTNYSHWGSHAGIGLEVIGRGGGNAKTLFAAWMASPGHRDTLMYDSESLKYLSAARAGSYWIITVWRDFAIDNAENLSTGAIPNFV